MSIEPLPPLVCPDCWVCHGSIQKRFATFHHATRVVSLCSAKCMQIFTKVCPTMVMPSKKDGAIERVIIIPIKKFEKQEFLCPEKGDLKAMRVKK